MSVSRTRTAESGNVLFYILIAVALIGALSFAVAQSGRGNIQKLSEERARLYATEMIEYANVLSSSVTQLKLRGCNETELSFENSLLAGHVNAGAPADNSCHIFELNGGGVHIKDFPEEAKANTTGGWRFTDDMEVEQIGTTCAGDACTELTMQALEVNDEVCKKLNAFSNIASPDTIPSQSNSSAADFTGSYTYIDTIGDEAGSVRLVSASAGCFYSTADAYNIFYKVLIAR